jgi:hypothetical protein
MKTIIAAVAFAAASANAGVLNVDLDPGDASVSAPLFSATFGVSGSLGIDVEQDGDGKLSNAGLSAADLLIASGGTYGFGLGGVLTLSNIGISLQEPGGQEYFYNETAGVPQPGDYAGFLDTDALASLSGTFAVDVDGDGTDEFTGDLSMIDEEYRTFDFEALITRDGGSSLYTVTTDFFLEVNLGFDGAPLPIIIEFSGGGTGVIPAPASWAALALAGLAAARRRR